MVAYLGEDWAALTASEIGLTWKASMSHGAYGPSTYACNPCSSVQYLALYVLSRVPQCLMDTGALLVS